MGLQFKFFVLGLCISCGYTIVASPSRLNGSQELQPELSISSKKWQVTTEEPRNTYIRVNGYSFSRKDNDPLVKLLEILATQPGNTEITVSKYNASGKLLLEPPVRHE